MFVEDGVKFLKEYFTKTNQTECYLYYNIKKDKFEMFPGKNNKKKEWQINLGIWSMFFDITVFENFLENMKLKWVLYSPDELCPEAKSEICNGAGPKGFGWTVPDLWFENASNFHDIAYSVGGDEEDRLWADKCFLWRMQEATSGIRNLGFMFPKIYYNSVRDFGKDAFHHGNKRDIKTLNKLYCKSE